MGVSHVLEEYRDGTPIAHIIKIGQTFAQAERYLDGMAAGLDVVRRAHALSAAEQETGRKLLEGMGSSFTPMGKWTDVEIKNTLLALGTVGQKSSKTWRQISELRTEANRRGLAPEDPRASWCGIVLIHGPHGIEAKGGPCPGLEEDWIWGPEPLPAVPEWHGPAEDATVTRPATDGEVKDWLG